MQKSKQFKRSLFIFRRDFRLEDNIGLINSLKESETVLPCFIFDDVQIEEKQNKYFSHNCVQFMIESLKDLDQQLQKNNSRLRFFKGNQKDVLNSIFKELQINSVYTNEDYTPYSIHRDKIIKETCQENKIQFIQFEDIMLLNKNTVLLDSKQFYRKFTPYYNQAVQQKVQTPLKNEQINYEDKKLQLKCEFSKNIDDFYTNNQNIEVNGGRELGLKILQNIGEKNKNYAEDRNIPTRKTTQLSAYLKFGCVSIRETYSQIKKDLGKKGEELIRQLYWRDFYLNIVYHYPHVVNNSMKVNYDKLDWDNNAEQIQKWKEGKTGVPIVDAGMRHMNCTGYMPNRLRMITSNYLVKILYVDWRIGEKYFAQKLVDYDLSNNNGGWQWTSGSGADSQPYFRIFNPKLQSEKFDKDCLYIKKWVPELKSCDNSHIHDWDKGSKFYAKQTLLQDYKTIVNYETQKNYVLEKYKQCFGDYLTKDTNQSQEKKQNIQSNTTSKKIKKQ